MNELEENLLDSFNPDFTPSDVEKSGLTQTVFLFEIDFEQWFILPLLQFGYRSEIVDNEKQIYEKAVYLGFLCFHLSIDLRVFNWDVSYKGKDVL